MPKLIFTEKEFSGRVYELVLQKTSVGRGDQNTLIIREGSLSSDHCEILVNGPEVIVRDLNSSNGTFVNGVRLQNQQSEVKHGQTLRFGSVVAKLEMENDGELREETDVTAMHDYRNAMRKPKRPEQSVAPAPQESIQGTPLEGPTSLLPKTATTEVAPTGPTTQNIQVRVPWSTWVRHAFIVTWIVLGLLLVYRLASRLLR